MAKLTKNDNGEQILPEVWLDWNTLSPDQMVEHLRKKYMFSSTGDAKCINYLIEFYNKYNEDNSHITEKMYLLAKDVVESYESKKLNIPDVISSSEECENEAISFTKDKMVNLTTLL